MYTYWKLLRLAEYDGEGVCLGPGGAEVIHEKWGIEDVCDRLGLDLHSMTSHRECDYWWVGVTGAERGTNQHLELLAEGEAWWVCQTIEAWAREADVDRGDSPLASLNRRARIGSRGLN